jgi:predicted nucleotidyltransferase
LQKPTSQIKIIKNEELYMCSQSALNEFTSKVVAAARKSLGDKLDRVILYGSYARGDKDNDSDIDIMVLANIQSEDQWRERNKIREILSNIELDYDIVLSLNVTDCATFNKFLRVEPFFQNILRDGVILRA